METEIITTEEIERLQTLKQITISSDEDYQRLGEIFDEDE